MSWNLITKSGHRANSGTYLVVATAKKRTDGTIQILKAKLGLKQ